MLVLAAGAGGAKVIGLLAIPLLTRIYTPEHFGLLVIFTTVVALVAPVVSLRYVMAIPLPKTDAMAFNVLAFSTLLTLVLTAFVAVVIGLSAAHVFPVFSVEGLIPYWWLIPIAMSYLFDRDLGVREYINMSGGTKQKADTRRIYVVRANGAIEPHRQRRGWFADTYYEHGAISASRSFVGEHTAGRLQTTARAGTPDHKYYTFDGSYVATTLGNWAFSIDAMPVWWGPGQENALVLSTNSRPVQAFRFNRLQDDPSRLPGLAWLGNWHATGFYGRTQNAGPLGDQEIAGGRVSVRPWSALTLGSSYTVEAGSGLGNRKQVLGADWLGI